MKLRDRLEMLKGEVGELNEEAILLIIEEKINRYERLLEMVESGEVKYSAGMVDAINKLENGIVEAIEKYLKLKYPAKYSLRLIKEDMKNSIGKDEVEELKKLMEVLVPSSDNGGKKGRKKK